MIDRTQLLTAFADTLVPSLRIDDDANGDRDDAVAAFLRRSASDAGVPEALATVVGEAHLAVLDELEARNFGAAREDGRLALLTEIGARGGADRQALRELKTVVMGVYYGTPDNPAWPALGYPGPVTAPPSAAEAPKTIRVEKLHGPSATLQADVVIVGSGAGGGVIAGELQAEGLQVVVLERAGYRNEQDFLQLEAVAARDMYLRGGLFWSETGSIGILAGATLGGGTVINSMICLRPPAHIREAWEAAGLEGLDGPTFDEHLDAVSTRINVNTERTIPNRVNELMAEALEARGLSWEKLPRNASDNDDPAYCGYCNAGCQQGCKRSTLVTYLQDAHDAGARIVVDCAVDRVLVEDGRAVGVTARAREADGSDVVLRVEAPTIVLAAGAIETPAVLLRSGIGGPAVGRNLRVHPTYFVGGVYDEDVQPWLGQFQALGSRDFADAGILVESVNVSLPFWAGSLPFTSGAAHKERMLKLRRVASWHALTHDHGAGEVVLGPDGEPVVRWQLDDPVDREAAARIHVELAKLHLARGASEIMTFHWDDLTWHEGEDAHGWLERLEVGPHDRTAYSAHQMGSCRMGADPATTVADGRGELHDVKGVWIGDASALPTAPGVNPMLTVMALARRTAHMIAAVSR